MFGLFKAAVCHDDVLGDLHYSVPDPFCLAFARELPGRYAKLRPDIQASLFEHYEPYREAVEEGALPLHGAPLPEIAESDAIWPYAAIRQVLIEPLLTSGHMVPTVEIAYRVEWDDEHTLGARVQDWRLVELCGSV